MAVFFFSKTINLGDTAAQKSNLPRCITGPSCWEIIKISHILLHSAQFSGDFLKKSLVRFNFSYESDQAAKKFLKNS